MTAAAPLLEVENLSAWYGAARALFGLDLVLRRGEVLALMGRNGAGKSTALKAVMGLIPEREGTVRLLGRDVSRTPSFRIARQGLGYVPEDRRIFTGLTVAENLDVGRQPRRHWPDGTSAPSWTPERLFRLFPALGAMTDRPGGRMSGGEQQMLTLARTLMGNPLVLLLDEPSEGVAPVVVEALAETILALKREGLSILLSEQNLHFAAYVADRVSVLEQGRIVHAASMEVFLRDDEAQARLLAP